MAISTDKKWRLAANNYVASDWVETSVTSTKTGTSSANVADPQRSAYWSPNASGAQSFTFDLQDPTECPIIGILPPTGDALIVQSITVQANNINDFTTPPLDQTLTVTQNGAYAILDTLETTTEYRYWKVTFTVQSGAENQLKVGVIYLGSYITTTYNIGQNWQENNKVISSKQVSISGVEYHTEFNKQRVFTGFGVNYALESDWDELQTTYQTVGEKTPFFILLDPQEEVYSDRDIPWWYVRFSGGIRNTHITTNNFATSFDLVEAL